MIFIPFFTRFGRERPAKKPRWAVFSLVFALEIAGETAVFCKGFAKGADLARAACGGEWKVGKRVFFAGFPFGLSPAVCTRVRQARLAGCAASRTMKGSWAKSRHVSRNSCALFHRSRAVLSPRTQQPHPRRQGEGGVGEMWPPRCCSGAARREGRATRPDQKRGPPPPGPPPGRPPLLPGCMGRKLPPGRSPRGWPSGRSGSLAPPKMLRR